MERRGQRGDVRYTLSEEGISYVTHRNRVQLPNTPGIRNTELIKDKHWRCPHLGHRIEIRIRQTRHANGVTWFLPELADCEPTTVTAQWDVKSPSFRTDLLANSHCLSAKGEPVMSP